jgi:hypothetical protein
MRIVEELWHLRSRKQSSICDLTVPNSVSSHIFFPHLCRLPVLFPRRATPFAIFTSNLARKATHCGIPNLHLAHRAYCGPLVVIQRYKRVTRFPSDPKPRYLLCHQELNVSLHLSVASLQERVDGTQRFLASPSQTVTEKFHGSDFPLWGELRFRVIEVAVDLDSDFQGQ